MSNNVLKVVLAKDMEFINAYASSTVKALPTFTYQYYKAGELFKRRNKSKIPDLLIFTETTSIFMWLKKIERWIAALWNQRWKVTFQPNEISLEEPKETTYANRSFTGNIDAKQLVNSDWINDKLIKKLKKISADCIHTLKKVCLKN